MALYFYEDAASLGQSQVSLTCSSTRNTGVVLNVYNCRECTKYDSCAFLQMFHIFVHVLWLDWTHTSNGSIFFIRSEVLSKLFCSEFNMVLRRSLNLVMIKNE